MKYLFSFQCRLEAFKAFYSRDFLGQRIVTHRRRSEAPLVTNYCCASFSSGNSTIMHCLLNFTGFYIWFSFKTLYIYHMTNSKVKTLANYPICVSITYLASQSEISLSSPSKEAWVHDSTQKTSLVNHISYKLIVKLK